MEVKVQGSKPANKVEIRAVEAGGEMVVLAEGQDGAELWRKETEIEGKGVPALRAIVSYFLPASTPVSSFTSLTAVSATARNPR